MNSLRRYEFQHLHVCARLGGARHRTDALTAFVATLTPEQKAKLAALLLGGNGG